MKSKSPFFFQFLLSFKLFTARRRHFSENSLQKEILFPKLIDLLTVKKIILDYISSNHQVFQLGHLFTVIKRTGNCLRKR